MKFRNIIIKSTLAFTLAFMASSAMASGGFSVKQLCETDEGTFLQEYKVQYLNAAINYHESNEVNGDKFDAVAVKLTKEGQTATWYSSKASMSNTDIGNHNSNDGMFSVIRMAYTLGVSVDACVKDGYLRGIELYAY